MMIYIKSILVGAITSVVSVTLFGLVPAIAMGIINSSEEGALFVDHKTIGVVALAGFLFGFTSMFRRSTRKYTTHF
jgi:hypothetical protein